MNTFNPDFFVTLGQESPERRLSGRAAARLRVMRSGRDGYFVEEEVTNVSRSGVMLKTRERLQVGERVELILMRPERPGASAQDAEYTVQAEIVRVTLLADGATYQVGAYFSFVEPTQKETLRRFIEDILTDPFSAAPLTHAPRIRIRLDPTTGGQHLEQLANLEERGLFIEVPQPISIFAQPRIRLVNPLTQEVHDLAGEIVHTQVMSTDAAGEKSLYGVGVRFAELSSGDREAVERLLTDVREPPGPKSPVRKTPTA